MDTQIQSLSQVEAVIDRVQIKAQTLSSDQSRAMAVAYIEARDVAQRLDDVCGPENWSDSYHVLQPGPTEWVVECRLSIGHPSPSDPALPLGRREQVTKCDVGLGDDAKAAYSDAFKRAAVKFGLGRFLYTLPKVWGAYDNSRRRFSDPSAVRAQMLQVHLPSYSGAEDTPATRTSDASSPAVAPVTAAQVPNLSEKQMHWLTEDLLRRPGVEVTVQACFEKIDSLSRAKRALGYLLSEVKGEPGSTVSLRPRFERVGSPEEWRKFIDEAKQLPLALPLIASH